MRTHEQIIDEHTPGGLAHRLYEHVPAGRWPTVQAFANAVWAWKRAKSIPAPYWKAVAAAEVATLEELAAAAARKVAA